MTRLASNKVQIATFVIATAVLSGTLQWLMIAQGDPSESGLVLPLMWTPGVVGIGCALFFGHRLKTLGFNRFGIRYIRYSYGVPCIAAVIIWTVLVVTGIGEPGFNAMLTSSDSGLPGPWVVVLLMVSVGVAGGGISALGEEIGWRGFLHNRMLDSGAAHPHVIIGLIWALWHWPLVLSADNMTSESPIVSVALFTITVVSFSVFMGWLRERTGSLWQASIAHSTHNIWVQGVYPSLLITTAPFARYVGGESGIVIAVVYGLLALALYQRDRTGRFVGSKEG